MLSPLPKLDKALHLRELGLMAGLFFATLLFAFALLDLLLWHRKGWQGADKTGMGLGHATVSLHQTQDSR